MSRDYPCRLLWQANHSAILPKQNQTTCCTIFFRVYPRKKGEYVSIPYRLGLQLYSKQKMSLSPMNHIKPSWNGDWRETVYLVTFVWWIDPIIKALGKGSIILFCVHLRPIKSQDFTLRSIHANPNTISRRLRGFTRIKPGTRTFDVQTKDLLLLTLICVHLRNQRLMPLLLIYGVKSLILATTNQGLNWTLIKSDGR